jgi:hypothetical protein
MLTLPLPATKCNLNLAGYVYMKYRVSQCYRWEDGIRMDLREIGWGECRLDPVGSGQGPVAGSCEYGDEPSGSGATELVS